MEIEFDAQAKDKRLDQLVPLTVVALSIVIGLAGFLGWTIRSPL